MQAFQLVAWKHPGELREVSEPEPKAGQVLVRIGGAGACHSDLHLMRDFDSGMLSFEPPFTLGHENAGWVEALGEGVEGLEIGEPVAVYGPWGCGRCRRCMMGLENYCEGQRDLGVMGGGLGRDGGMAPYMVVPDPRLLLPLGDLDPISAAPLTDAGLTAYHAVKRSLELLVPGSTALVIGVGGLGHMAVQFLRELTPANIVAADEREEALSLARDVGARHTVLTSDDPKVRIAEITSGAGVDVVLDFVGVDSTLALGADVVRSLGHLTIVGLGGGSLSVSFFGIAYEASIATTYWGSKPELVEVLALASSGRIGAHIDKYSLDQAPEAYEAVQAGRVHGRAVIVP